MVNLDRSFLQFPAGRGIHSERMPQFEASVWYVPLAKESCKTSCAKSEVVPHQHDERVSQVPEQEY
jgi:hypothetical protein